MPEAPQRKLAAIMFTDIAGYTALMSQDEEKALQLLQKNRALLKPIIGQFRGEWLKEIGDGTLSSFASAVDAVNCALVIKRTLKDDPELSLRIGIHIGDVVFERGDVFGDGVNVASRIEPLAEPGGIVISERVYDDIRNKPGIETTSLGEQTLKGIDHPIRVFTVTEQRGILKEPETVPAKPGKPRWMVWGVAGAVAVAVAVAVMVLNQSGGPGPEAALGAKSIAVLPFVNFSDSKEDEYFSDGITDDILTHLCKVGDLNVIARTSSMQYKGTDKRPREIAQELGVATILEGSVRRYGNKVRIVSQLIDARTEKHLWAEEYDRELTDIFAIQSDVARQIAAALKATLTPEEEQRIEDLPTNNLEAYDYFLRGNDFLANSNYAEKNFRIAIKMYEKAIKLDPAFALAYTQLSRAHSFMFWFYYDRSEEYLAKAKEAADNALQIDPDLPEAHLALGHYYYHGLLDYDQALEHFAIAQKSQPNNADLFEFIGYVQRRQGKFFKALASLKKAAELNPRSATQAFDVGLTYALLRKYPEAEFYYNRAMTLSPDWPRLYWHKARLYLHWNGSIDRTRFILAEASRNSDHLDPFIVHIWTLFNIFAGNYQEALDHLSIASFEAFETQLYFIPKAQLYAHIYGLTNEAKLEQVYYDSARIMLESRIREQPEDSRLHSSLGIAYASLGRKEEALRAGQKGVELLPISQDAYRGYYREWDLAIIYTMVGEYEAAIDKLAYLLSIPGDLSVPWLRLDPTWDPLREHPRFQALVEKYGEQ